MPIIYRIYSNHGTGGPVDYSTPVATTAGITYVTDPLPPASDSTFVVRAFDTITNLEEANTEARVQVVVGADGQDLSDLPKAPHALSISPTFGGGCRVSWAFAPAGTNGLPVGFYVYLTKGQIAVDSTPTATVPFVAGRIGYSYTLPGPFSPATYSASVRSFNNVGVEANTQSVMSAIGITAEPFAMEPLQVEQLVTTAV
jgi:hypothetical protein